MRILFLSYWNLSDPLTTATVLPTLQMLEHFSWVESIVFVNVERRFVDSNFSFSGKITYRPFQSKSSRKLWAQKFYDYTQAPVFISDLIKTYEIDCIIARGSPAGALAYLTWRKIKTPFFVDYFEPHAEYMREPGIWKWYDLRYLISKYLEIMQKKVASGLMPVADNYTKSLLKEGIADSRMKTVPCMVDKELFSFSLEIREKMRSSIGLNSSDRVGIYVGRYGGLYLEEEAFDLYKMAFSYFKDKFFLILLVPEDHHSWIRVMIDNRQLPKERILIRSVMHYEVPQFLSASDFGFATYRPGKSKACLSPVKIGEYWANGLPVLLTRGVGDESEMIEQDGNSGVLFDVLTLNDKAIDHFDRLKRMINPENRERIPHAMLRNRDISIIRNAYNYFLREGRRDSLTYHEHSNSYN